MHKLCSLGVRKRSLQWLKLFIENRCCQVIMGQECSKEYPVETEVIQGSVLSSYYLQYYFMIFFVFRVYCS